MNRKGHGQGGLLVVAVFCLALLPFAWPLFLLRDGQTLWIRAGVIALQIFWLLALGYGGYSLWHYLKGWR